VTATFTPGQPVLEIGKTTDSPLVAGGTIVYTIAYGNVGSGTATSVVITETVPAHTRFAAGASSPGWSCPDASPPGTTCMRAVPDLAPGGQGTLTFAVVVENPLTVLSIVNSVEIRDSEGGSGGGSDIVYVPAPAPALRAAGLTAALLALAAIARRTLRRR
jgi:uncharacterized repeat protein (TIGR01451 family)